MVGIHLSIPAGEIAAEALRRGLRINCTQDTILRMLPALNITTEQIDRGFDILGEVFAANQTEVSPT